MRKPIAWFLGVCAAWWFLCLMFPLLAYILAGATFSLTGRNPQGLPFLFLLFGFAVVGAIPVSRAAVRVRTQWRLSVVVLCVTVLLVICFGSIAVGSTMRLCRFETNGCAPA